ncbi:peroxiredoxin [Bacteroidota bacterium]|nr:peroxiredoxin [Bacteroidota bacterium]
MSLAVGDKAPVFSGTDQDGNKISLKDFKGKKLILYFYPKDDTSGCTAESCNLRDNRNVFKKKKIQVIGVSADDEKSHKKFIEKFDLNFPLIADTNKKIIKDYGVWGEKMLYGRKYMGIIRKTFVIDEKGKIEKIFEAVDTKNHSEQILESYLK